MMRAILVLAAILLACPALADGEAVVFVGLPTSLSFTSAEGVKQLALEGSGSGTVNGQWD